LNDVSNGGRTVFPNLYAAGTSAAGAAAGNGTQARQCLAVAPQQGSALVFFPADRVSGLTDARTLHFAEAAVDEKWVCQVWKRQRTVPAPLGLAPP
jgi:hypothetical protein